ncbi:transposase domain protein, partial [Candidatus Erwinia dacicola]
MVKTNQTRITGMDNQILSLYAKGMTTREIATALNVAPLQGERYGFAVPV